jgi:predicted extracellular nuclease
MRKEGDFIEYRPFEFYSSGSTINSATPGQRSMSAAGHISRRKLGELTTKMKKRTFAYFGILLTVMLTLIVTGSSLAAPVLISEIQGDGQFSPYEGQIVTTEGIVTLITANGRDMWIQDPVGDGNPATSDGIFVDDRDRLSPRPEVGDLVQITGEVEELQFGAALPLTRIDDPHRHLPYDIISSGNPLPAPVPLIDLPNDSPADGVLADGIAFWEPLEGMLVSAQNGVVVAPTTRFGEFGFLTRADAKPGSGYYPETKQILLNSLGPNMVDYNPERILVDDSSLDDPILVHPGDQVRSLVGVVDYTFGMYKLQPASYDVFSHRLPKMPVSTRSGPNGDTVITTFNVENLFDLVLNTPTTIDAFGEIGFDPGSEWSGGGIGTQNETLQRKSSVCAGDTISNDPFDPSVEWNGFAENTFTGLGAHTVTCGSVTDLFISEYVEGSSNNKALEIYNGTGSPVDLAAGGYAIAIYFNGNPSANTTIQLTGTVAPGDVYVVADDGADPLILAVADQTSTSSFFNGDDAIVLRKGGKDDASSTPSPAALETKLTKLAMAIEVELELPDIIVVQEIENQAIAQELADRVNAATGTAYVATSFETSDGRGIEAGFLWDADRVDLLDAFQLSGSDVEAAFGPGSASPGREPLYGKFLIGGNEVHIVGNHFKSKSGDDPPYGVTFTRITEVQRKLQSQVVRDFVDTILDANPDALVMVTGDLNDFQFGEPGEGTNHTVGILEGVGGGVPLTNLINLEKDDERYTFIFDGNSQVLDHMLVSPALFDMLVGVDVLHFNASYISDLGSDESTTLRASDHDPLEGRFRLLK